jgi:WD40 repeat protein
VATLSWDSTASIWDITNITTNWTLIRTYTGHAGQVFGVEFINEDLVVTGSNDGSINIWSICTGLTLRTITAASGVFSLKLINTGTDLACGLLNGNINIYNINNGSLKLTLFGHTSNVRDLVLISSSNLLASSSGDRTVRIWNLTSNTCKFTLNGHSGAVYGLKSINSDDLLASGSSDFKIILWNITSGKLIRNFTGHNSGINWAVDRVLEDDQTLVSGSYDTSFKLWNIHTGDCLRTKRTGSGFKALSVLNTTFSSACIYIY